TTDYLFGFEYENGVLQTFPHAEGYVKNNGGNYVYHYIYRDHLGNNRLVYADLNNNGTIEPATEIVEENNYYPFGLKHEGYNELPGDGYKYKLNGKEYEDSFALNVTETDFRHYDSALGRFNVIDPLSELAYDFTPYRYGFNNPVVFSDPSGLFESYETAVEYRKSNKLFGATIEFDSDSNLWKIIDGDSTITQVGKKINTMYMMNGEMYLEQTNAGGGGSGDGSNWGAKLSADFTNSYSSSGFRHAVNWFNRNVDFGIYDFLYNNSAVTGYGSGAYGAYIPDATSFSIGGSVSGFIFSANFSVGIAVTNTDAALVLAGDFGFGLNAETPGAALGVGFGAHDMYGGATDVLSE